jgi:hypothetical protein
MDILSDSELQSLISQSTLVGKYNEVIDRESAYELLNRKIERAADEAGKEDPDPPRQRTRSRASTRQNPIIKVLTSATFIRGVLGVLKKVIR